MNRIKKYQLSDGNEYTVEKLSKIVNAPPHIIHARLCRSKDPKRVLAPWSPRKNGRKPKNFKMKDTGEWVTCWDVVKRVNCSLAMARKRLNRYDTAEEVFAPKQDLNQDCESNQVKKDSYTMRRIKSRGMFDDMLALAMRVI